MIVIHNVSGSVSITTSAPNITNITSTNQKKSDAPVIIWGTIFGAIILFILVILCCFLCKGWVNITNALNSLMNKMSTSSSDKSITSPGKYSGVYSENDIIYVRLSGNDNATPQNPKDESKKSIKRFQSTTTTPGWPSDITDTPGNTIQMNAGNIKTPNGKTPDGLIK